MDKLTVTPASFEEKGIFENLMHLYLYDFSEYTGDDVDDQGRFLDEYLPRYWVEPTRYPFLVRVDGKFAGFVMVRDVIDPDSDEVVHHMAEFFVMKKYRRQKVGWQTANRVFDLFPGRWHVAQEEKNLPAQQFWRKVINAYTQGKYQEIQDAGWNGPIQAFQSPGAL